MHRQVIVSQVHRMGMVSKPETLKASPLTEVKVLARSLDTNRSPEISLMLGRYRGYNPSTEFTRPRD
jgi:hypothetical protein